MKVCDKCRKNGGTLYKIEVKGIKAELCDSCSDRIIKWLETHETTSPLAMLFGGKK